MQILTNLLLTGDNTNTSLSISNAPSVASNVPTLEISSNSNTNSSFASLLLANTSGNGLFITVGDGGSATQYNNRPTGASLAGLPDTSLFLSADHGSGAKLEIHSSTGGGSDGNILLLPVTGSFVGIFKTNPAYALDVTGDVNISGTFRVGGVPFTGSSTSPGGSSGAIQFNNSGAFGGDATNFNWSESSLQMTINQWSGSFNFASTDPALIVGGKSGGTGDAGIAIRPFTNTASGFLEVSGGAAGPAYFGVTGLGGTIGRDTTANGLGQIVTIWEENGASIQFGNGAVGSMVFMGPSGRVSIGAPASPTPSFQLDVAGDINTSTSYRVSGSILLDSNGAYALKDATGTVSVSAATAPSSGQVLTATSSTTATWQTPANGSSTAPTTTNLTSGSGTYTTPAGAKWIKVRMVGGGGGGGNVNGGTPGGTGGTTTFNSVNALGGSGGSNGDSSAQGGGGGTGGTGSATFRSPGGAGRPVDGAGGHGGEGGMSLLGGGAPGPADSTTANNGSANSGGGASGVSTAGFGSGGGGGGEYVELLITSPAATYSYVVGAGGAAGTGATSFNGGVGGSGVILVEEHYNF